MGLLSVLLVRHDCLHETQDDMELGKKIYDTILRFSHRGDPMLRRVSNGVELVAGDIHASSVGLVVVEGNTAYHVEEVMCDNKALPDWSKAEARMVDILKQLGYKVARPHTKKK